MVFCLVHNDLIFLLVISRCLIIYQLLLSCFAAVTFEISFLSCGVQDSFSTNSLASDIKLVPIFFLFSATKSFSFYKIDILEILLSIFIFLILTGGKQFKMAASGSICCNFVAKSILSRNVGSVLFLGGLGVRLGVKIVTLYSVLRQSQPLIL